MRKRWIAIVASLLVAPGVALMLSPVPTLLAINRAARAGDAAAIVPLVDFPAVRATLKVSLGDMAHGRVESSGDPAEQRKRGMFQRIKAATMPAVTDAAVDRYITAEGLPQLFKMRQTWRNVADRTAPSGGKPDRPTTDRDHEAPGAAAFLPAPIDRGIKFLSRIEAVRWPEWTRAEFRLADRRQPTRSYVATFDLRGTRWILTGVRVMQRQSA